MPLRIGLVGAGANTKLRHIPGFRALPDVELVAVCNRSRESGQRVAEEFGIPRVFGDWKALVHSDDVDAVCIGTWPNTHAPIALEALAVGKHVLGEARMAADLAQAREMLAASERSDRVAMVVPAPLYLEPEPVLLERLADGAFGELLEIHVRGLGGGYDPEAPLHWRQRRDRSGDNILSMGILNETVRRYAGHDRFVLAHGRVVVPERRDPETGRKARVDVPDSLGIVSELERGATAVYHLSSVAHLGPGAHFEFYGTRGCFKLEDGGAWVASRDDREFRPLEIPGERRGGWRVEADFVAAIREGRPVTRTSFRDGVRYMAFSDAVQTSLREGRRVAVPA